MKYYYAGPDNKTAGPVTLDEIQAMIKNGTLKSDPMVVPEGGTDWKPLSAHTSSAPAGGPPPPAGGPPPPPFGPNQASIAAEKAKEASKDALGAFQTLASNPVGGLAPSFEGLGAARALGVGIAFCVVLLIFEVASTYRSGLHPSGFGGFMKVVLFSIVPIAAFVAATLGARMACGGQGNFNQDCFIAGAALLPLTLAGIINTIIVDGTVAMLSGVFAISLTVLMLNAGLTRLDKLTERAASLAVPAIILVGGLAKYLMVREMMKAAVMSPFGGGNFPGFQ